MSNLLSALNGRVAAGTVTVRDEGLQGMITLRGNFEDENFGAALDHIAGVALPDVRTFSAGEGRGAAWMSPDELMIFVPYEDAAAITAQLAEALAETHVLVVNVSDARALISVTGQGATEVMAKNVPVDLHPEVFVPGMLRRTRLGQVAAAFWKEDAEAYKVICFRSVSEYVFGVLAQSAKDGAVGVF